MVILETPDAVLRALGGTSRAAALTGKSAASISNAKRRGWFPRDSYAVMKAELEQLGVTAPASLWKQVGPSHKEGEQ